MKCRPGNRKKNGKWKDVLGVLMTQRGRLDQKYLRHAARHQGVEKVLEKAIIQMESDEFMDD